jgi:hypothetical protein
MRGARLETNKMSTKTDRKARERYLTKFLTGRNFALLHACRIFPNPKEITESFGAFQAVQRHSGFDQGDPDVLLVCVGDGRSPRTAATFAAQSRWRCHSVDPLATGGDRKFNRALGNLRTHKLRIEQMPVMHAECAVIVAVHSHARLPEAVAKVQANRLCIVAMPCCVPQSLDVEPDIRYRDSAVWSPCNEVLVWKRYVRPDLDMIEAGVS